MEAARISGPRLALVRAAVPVGARIGHVETIRTFEHLEMPTHGVGAA
jgi:hypothetical protein